MNWSCHAPTVPDLSSYRTDSRVHRRVHQTRGGTVREPKMAACHLLAEASQRCGLPNIMCTRAFDCSECSLFQQHVERLAHDRQGGQLSWVCPFCVSARGHRGDEGRKLIGFYDSGACSYCNRVSGILSAIWEDDPATSSGGR